MAAKELKEVLQTPVWFACSKRLSKEERDSLFTHVVVIGQGGPSGEKIKLGRLLVVVDDIEREWGLI